MAGRDNLPESSALLVTVLLATLCLMSVERDFDHTVAAFIQVLLVLVLASSAIAIAQRRSAAVPISLSEQQSR